MVKLAWAIVGAVGLVGAWTLFYVLYVAGLPYVLAGLATVPWLLLIAGIMKALE